MVLRTTAVTFTPSRPIAFIGIHNRQKYFQLSALSAQALTMLFTRFETYVLESVFCCVKILDNFIISKSNFL
jgi:hypothetical protein